MKRAFMTRSFLVSLHLATIASLGLSAATFAVQGVGGDKAGPP